MRNTKVRFSFISIFLFLLMYKLALEFVYIYLISPKYKYMNFNIEIDIHKFIFSIIYLIVIAAFQPKDKEKTSTYLFLIIEYFIVIPILSYYWLNNMNSIYTFYLFVSTILLSKTAQLKIKPFFVRNRLSQIIINITFVVYIISTIYIVGARGGIDPRALDFDTVYELRSEYNLYGILGYLTNWSVKVFCPFFVGYFYLKKKRIAMILVLLLQVMMYLSFGNKAFLFSLGIILLNLWIVKRGSYVKEMSITMAGINILAFILDYGGITDSLQRAIPYRLIYIPAQIQYYYYEFFVNRDKLFFADNVIGRILSIKSPFNSNISFIIGGTYYGTSGEVNANTGIFADAYANGGFSMMLIATALFGLLLALIDASTSKIPTYFVVGALSYIMFVINDAPLITTLITGGMLLMVFLLIVFNSSYRHDII